MLKTPNYKKLDLQVYATFFEIYSGKASSVAHINNSWNKPVNDKYNQILIIIKNSSVIYLYILYTIMIFGIHFYIFWFIFILA